MREGISYAFLLNIIILFITVCAAVVMGIFSYNRAFRANSIITETIEKYEGYNCLAQEEIENKLQTISYNTPFTVECKNSDGNCETNTNKTYKVISYNLDFDYIVMNSPNPEDHIIYGDKMNSTYQCYSNGCITNKNYQYGVYTYMYFDIPVLSKIARIPVYSRTSKLFEFRNFYVEKHKETNNMMITDVESIFDTLYTRELINGKIYVKDGIYGKEVAINTNSTRKDVSATEFFTSGFKVINADLVEGKLLGSYENLFKNITGDSGVNYRIRAMLLNKIYKAGPLNTISSKIQSQGFNGGTMKRDCGFKLDYELVNKSSEAFR